MFEQLSSSWWILILIGLGAGVLSRMLGVGSGIVVVPVLATFFLVPQKSAQGTALAVMVPMALLGAIRYWYNPEVQMSIAVVALLVVGALAGTLVGTELAARLPAHWLRKAFAVLLVIVAIRMFSMSPQPKPSSSSTQTAAAAANPKGPSR